MDDVYWMKQALQLAQKSFDLGEVPVGAVIVNPEGELIGSGYNYKEKANNPLGHAELMAISEASQKLKNWRLNGCSLYVTLEPCIMCAGAILQSRIKKVIFGTDDLKTGAVQSLYQVLTDPRLNHRCEVVSGFLKEECAQMLSRFFQELRDKK